MSDNFNEDFPSSFSDRSEFIFDTESSMFFVRCPCFMGPLLIQEEHGVWRINFAVHPKKNTSLSILGSPQGGDVTGYLQIGSFASYQASLVFLRYLCQMISCSNLDPGIQSVTYDILDIPVIMAIDLETPCDPHHGAKIASALIIQLEDTPVDRLDDLIAEIRSHPSRRDIGTESSYDYIMNTIHCLEDKTSDLSEPIEGQFRSPLIAGISKEISKLEESPLLKIAYRYIDLQSLMPGMAPASVLRSSDILSPLVRRAAVRMDITRIEDDSGRFRARSSGRLSVVHNTLNLDAMRNEVLKKSLGDLLNDDVERLRSQPSVPKFTD